MKGNIRTKAYYAFKYSDRHNNTYKYMMKYYVYLNFFADTYDERSIRDICKIRKYNVVPAFIHEWWQSRPYRQMHICHNIGPYMGKFNRDEYEYSMREFR